MMVSIAFINGYNGYQSESTSASNSDHLFTKQASVSYKIIEPLKVYAGYTEGYRIPSLQDLYLGGNHPENVPVYFKANPNLSPEIGRNKTIGLVYDQAFAYRQKVKLSANVFLNDVTNYILNSTVELKPHPQKSVNQNINAPEARLYGYMLSANYRNAYS